MYIGLDDFVPMSARRLVPSSGAVTAVPAAATTATDVIVAGGEEKQSGDGFATFRAAHPMPAPTHDLEQAKRDLDEHGVAVILDAMSAEMHAAIMQRVAEQGEAEWSSGHALRNTQPIENGRNQVRLSSLSSRFWVVNAHVLRNLPILTFRGSFFCAKRPIRSGTC